MAVIRDRYELEIDTGRADAALGGLKNAVGGFVAALSVRQVVDFGNQIVRTTDQMQNYTNRLSLVTNSQAELESLMGRLTVAAQQNRASFGETAELYSTLAVSTEALGYSTEQNVEIMSAFQRALAISGADANTASGAIRQFGQAMGSGTVRGDEFNSIVEALGPALGIMARESGLTVGQLREMSQAGELTSKAFAEMLMNSEALNQSFAGMSETTAQLETAFGDAFSYAVVQFDQLVGITDAYQASLISTTRLLDSITGREGALVNIEDPTEIFNSATQGVIAYDSALAELETRLVNAPGLMLPGVGLVFEEDRQYVETLRQQIAELERLKAAETAAADAKTQKSAVDAKESNAQSARVDSIKTETTEIEQQSEKIREQAAIRAETLRQTQDNEISLGEARKLISENEQAAVDALNLSTKTRSDQMAQEIQLLSPLIEQNTLYGAALSGVHLNQTDVNESLLAGITANQNIIAVEDSRTNGLEQMRGALVAAAAAQRELNTALASQNTTRSGTTGLGNLFGLPTSNTADPIVGARALGGLVSKGRSYLVNENGREMFTPGATGTVIPLGEGADSGLNVNFTVHATDTVGFDAYLNRRRGDIVNLVRQAMQENRGRF
jgi:tape measure domain-containing protein